MNKRKNNKCKNNHVLTPENTYIYAVKSIGCRLCRNDISRRYRQRNKEEAQKYGREYMRMYRIKNPIPILNSSKICNKRWASENPDKVKAHIQVKYAIKSQKLKRLPCEICGEKKTDGHHPDYKKPLEVVWLCRIHHMAEHKKLLVNI